RAIDLLRRKKLIDRKHEEVGREVEVSVPDLDAALDDDVGDDLLRLMLISCHPVLPTEARVALTLRLLGGLTTEEIARAFLVPEPTIAQRIVRAKRTLADEQVPFEVPRREELAARLASVLEVVYLVFNEGYSATPPSPPAPPAPSPPPTPTGRASPRSTPPSPSAPRPPSSTSTAPVAISMAYGPAAALPLVDALVAEPTLARYHLLPTVRADLLA